MRSRTAVLAAAALSLLACEREPLAPTVRQTVVRFDVSALYGGAGGQPGRLSVLDRVRLTAEPSPEPPQERPLSAGATTIDVPITVIEGSVQFTAEVYSTNGQLLYEGSHTQTIHADNFTVTIDVDPVNAVLLVEPAAIDLQTVGSADVTVRNAGIDTLTWSVSAPCDDLICLTVDSNDPPALDSGGIATLRVSGFSEAPARATSIRVDSNVGSVEIAVSIAPDANAPVATLSGIPFGSVNPQEVGWAVTYTDPSVPSSGFATDPVRARLRRIDAAGSTCFSPGDPFTQTALPCTRAGGTIDFQPAANLISIDDAPDGYWQLLAFVLDRAGNSSDTLAGLTLIDGTEPQVTRISAPDSIPGAAAVTFSASASDNVELASASPWIRYGPWTFAYPSIPIGSYGESELSSSADLDFDVPFFVRAVQGTDAANRVARLPAIAEAVAFDVVDIAGNRSSAAIDIQAAVLAPVPGGMPDLSIPFGQLNAADPRHGLFTQHDPSESVVCRSASGCRNPATTVLQATVTGPAATFANPFQHVEFYCAVHPPEGWSYIGRATVSVSDNTVLNTRTFTYTLPWTVTGVVGVDGQPLLGDFFLVAVGIDASGSAVMTTGAQRPITILSN